MEQKVIIISETKSNLFNALCFLMKEEQINYVVADSPSSSNDDVTYLMILGSPSLETKEYIKNAALPIMIMNHTKEVVETKSEKVNYIVTPLIDDFTPYSEVQREYLFRKGSYHIILQKVYELMESDHEIDRMAIDFSDCVKSPKDWIFHFESIAESYAWLSYKNKTLSNTFIEKTINFYHDKVYNDSAKEINYLTEKIQNIKQGKHRMDIFVCTREEYDKLNNNYFFQMLKKNRSNTYQIYIVNRERLQREEPIIYQNLLDGIIIYEDCVYRDTYDDEYSLGYVDCKTETIHRYNTYFDYIVKQYGEVLTEESEDNAVSG